MGRATMGSVGEVVRVQRMPGLVMMRVWRPGPARGHGRGTLQRRGDCRCIVVRQYSVGYCCCPSVVAGRGGISEAEAEKVFGPAVRKRGIASPRRMSRPT